VSVSVKDGALTYAWDVAPETDSVESVESVEAEA